MSKNEPYIGFDLGAESGRSIVGTITSGTLKLKETHRFYTPMIECRGHVYWDILRIYQELEQGLMKSGELFGAHFDGISIDTWGVDYVLLDSEDRLLGYPYHYRDVRTDNIMEYAFERIPREKIYHYTGTAFMQLNTLFQLYAETRQKLNLCSVAGQFLTIPDYLLYLLSGIKKGEFTIASTTQLTDPYKRSWCWKIKSTGFTLKTRSKSRPRKSTKPSSTPLRRWLLPWRQEINTPAVIPREYPR